MSARVSQPLKRFDSRDAALISTHGDDDQLAQESTRSSSRLSHVFLDSQYLMWPDEELVAEGADLPPPHKEETLEFKVNTQPYKAFSPLVCTLGTIPHHPGNVTNNRNWRTTRWSCRDPLRKRSPRFATSNRKSSLSFGRSMKRNHFGCVESVMHLGSKCLWTAFACHGLTPGLPVRISMQRSARSWRR
jgi:hypothetical protein